MNEGCDPGATHPRANKRRFFCQVFGCSATLPKRTFYKKNKICAYHANEPQVGLGAAGAFMARFCQKCMRFQELSEFDGLKKSCRRSLIAHSKNRKRAREQSRAESAAEVAKVTARAASPGRAARRVVDPIPAAGPTPPHGRPDTAPNSNDASSAAALNLDTPPAGSADPEVILIDIPIAGPTHAVSDIPPAVPAGQLPFCEPTPVHDKSRLPHRVCSLPQTDCFLAATPSPHETYPVLSSELLQSVLLSSGEISDEDFALLPPVVTLPGCEGEEPPDLFGPAFAELRRVSQELLRSSGELYPDILRILNGPLN